MSVISATRSVDEHASHEVPHMGVVDTGLLPGYYSLCYSSLLEGQQDKAAHPLMQDESSRSYCDFMTLLKKQIEAILGIESCEFIGPVFYVEYRVADRYRDDEIMQLMITSVIEYMMFRRIEEIFGLPKDSLRVNRRLAEPFSSSDEY